MMHTATPTGGWHCPSCHASIAVYGVISVSCPYCQKPMIAISDTR